MLRFHKGEPIKKGRLGVFPGAFNPVTSAHLALADAAQQGADLDQVLFVLPESFPHKDWEGAALEQRIELLKLALESESRWKQWAIASSSAGLFIEIAREVREDCGKKVKIFLLCGADAAERAATWDYQDLPPFGEQLKEFQMIVASRRNFYTPPPEYQHSIQWVELPESLGTISSTKIRKSVQEGRPWEHWTPEPVSRRIQELGLYQGS